MRVKAVIAYDGSHYQGFQKQRSTKMTVTSAIEEALASLHIHSPIVGAEEQMQVYMPQAR